MRPVGVYRCKGVRSILVASAVLVSWWLFFALYAIVKRGGSRPVESLIFLVCSFIIIFLMVLVSVFGKSDVVLYKDSISFRLFAWTWKTIRFEDVGKIKEFELTIPFAAARPSKVFSLYPKKAGHFYKFVFDDQLSDIGELIEALNVAATKYKIPIYVEINGKYIVVSRIVL